MLKSGACKAAGMPRTCLLLPLNHGSAVLTFIQHAGTEQDCSIVITSVEAARLHLHARHCPCQPTCDSDLLSKRECLTQAAQALEAACLVALRLLTPGGACVLVGDPQQLPATVISRAAEAGHLAQSLFERLQRVLVPDCVLLHD